MSSVAAGSCGVSGRESSREVIRLITNVDAYLTTNSGSAFLIWIIAYNMSGATTYVCEYWSMQHVRCPHKVAHCIFPICADLPFATSNFSMHTIIGTIGVVTLIMGGVLPPFWAKVADLVSRPWALLGALVFYTVGYATTAGSNTVSAVSAGQVVYTMGKSASSTAIVCNQTHTGSLYTPARLHRYLWHELHPNSSHRRHH